MTNNIESEFVLDELVKNRLTKVEAKELLARQGLSNLDVEIDLHFASVKAIQQYAILKQVQSVHSSFMHSEPNAENSIGKAPIMPSRMVSMRWVMGVAASLFVFAATWFTYQYSTNDGGKLYSEIYQPYNVNTDRGIGEISTHNLIQEFKNEDYKAVIKTYESLLNTNIREKFLTGYAYHQVANYNKSIELLRQLLKYNKLNKTRLYNDEAEFYLALSYLKINDIVSAAELFKSIRSNPDHTFHETVTKWNLTRLNWLK